MDIGYITEHTGALRLFNSNIEVPSKEHDMTCTEMNIFASELTLMFTNFELAPCMKVVVYGNTQHSCEAPSQDVCSKTFCGNNALVNFKEDKCVCSCKHGYVGDPYHFCYGESDDQENHDAPRGINHLFIHYNPLTIYYPPTLTVKAQWPAAL